MRVNPTHKAVVLAPDGETRLICVDNDMVKHISTEYRFPCNFCFFATIKQDIESKPGGFVSMPSLWCEDAVPDNYPCLSCFYISEAFLPQFLKRIGKTEL